jgi:hypothetical protein
MFPLERWPWTQDVPPNACAPNWDLHSARMTSLAAAELGEWALVESELLKGGDVALNDAACLNLLGLAAEVRSDWPRAKHMYGRAMRRDHSYLPAEVNMRRYYELFTLGKTSIPKCLRFPPSTACVGFF